MLFDKRQEVCFLSKYLEINTYKCTCLLATIQIYRHVNSKLCVSNITYCLLNNAVRCVAKIVTQFKVTSLIDERRLNSRYV